MKWFWFSLIVFCILMCSCKTKKLDSHVKVKSEVRSDLAILNESVKISTKNHAYFANEAQNIVIEEDIVVTEYDKETGKAVKETKTTRKIAQDTDKVVAEEENQAVTNSNQLEVEHFREDTKMVSLESLDCIGVKTHFHGILSLEIVNLFLIVYRARCVRLSVFQLALVALLLLSKIRQTLRFIIDRNHVPSIKTSY